MRPIRGFQHASVRHPVRFIRLTSAPLQLARRATTLIPALLLLLPLALVALAAQTLTAPSAHADGAHVDAVTFDRDVDPPWPGSSAMRLTPPARWRDAAADQH